MFDSSKPSYIIQVNGGAGKHILFSGVAKNVKEQFPDHNLVVVCAYPELLLNLPFIDRVYRTGSTPYLYEDLVTVPESKGSAVDPYLSDGYLLEKEHLIETWSGLLEAPKSYRAPSIDLSIREIDFLKTRFRGQVNNRPLLVLNPFGGSHQQQFKYNWARDIPPQQAQQIVDEANSLGYAVVQVGRSDQIQLDNCLHFDGPLREIASLLLLSEKRILIDSFCQHCAAALGLESTVLWITNKPRVFGHPIHTDVFARTPDKQIHKIDSLFQQDNWTGEWLHYFPYNDQNVFDVDEVLSKTFSTKIVEKVVQEDK